MRLDQLAGSVEVVVDDGLGIAPLPLLLRELPVISGKTICLPLPPRNGRMEEDSSAFVDAENAETSIENELRGSRSLRVAVESGRVGFRYRPRGQPDHTGRLCDEGR